MRTPATHAVFSQGYHSTNYRSEPLSPWVSDSSSFHFVEKEYFGLGTSYGNYTYSGKSFSDNPNYEDPAQYGPGYESSMSSFYAFHPTEPIH